MLSNKIKTAEVIEQVKDKQAPSFLNLDYPFKAAGETITDLDLIKPDEIFEIKCLKCDMAIRSRGKNIRTTYERLKNVGCIGCGNNDLIIQRIDMGSANNQ